MKEKNKILSRKNISVAIRFFRRSLLINLATMLFPFLLISVYCMVHIYQECTYNFEQNSSLILTQADRVLEGFYEGIDSAYLILSTDSDINRLLRSLFEEEASLETIRFAEILSANFRNTIFTDDYIQNIYFYLNNEDNRVLTTLNKRVTKLDEEEFAHIGEALMQEEEDVWTELYDSPIRLFMEQDYFKMRDLQKSTQLQLSRIKALQHQINPHFMNNTLNVIYWEAIRLGGGENECSRMIQLLSEFMRYSLSDPPF